MALSVLGCLPSLDGPVLAIVGARRASRFALLQSYGLGHLMAGSPWVVVSGGAYGCDIAAHRGVLGRGGGNMVVVVPGGLANLYPRGHRDTYRLIVKAGGCVVSERLWDAVPRPHDFVVRNRIIAGLSRDVAIMQAGERSGAMTTARVALEQGREVLVLRPPETLLGAEGSWRLIAEGAFSFATSGELWRELLFRRRLA